MMSVTIWGTRGSLPAPGPRTVRYGGNTSCVSIEVAGQPLTVIDAGTGIANLALSLGLRDQFACNLLLGHLHWDHFIGLPFFFTADAVDSCIDVYGPGGDVGLRQAVESVMQPPGFPIRSSELRGTWNFHDIGDDEFTLGRLTVTSRTLRHRGPTVGFRIEGFGATLAYISDHGPGAEDRGPEHDEMVPDAVVELVRDADILLHDSQHTPEEYARFRHFGHCTPGYAVRVANAGAVKELLLYHHDPRRHDDAVDMMVGLAHKAAAEEGYDGAIRAAVEGERFTLGAG